MGSKKRTSWFRPLIVFLSFSAYFAFADLTQSLHKYTSLLSPNELAYNIWLPIYATQFAFVCYQLISKTVRDDNSLVKKKLLVPFVLHQALFAVWLKLYESEAIVAAAVCQTGVYAMAFTCYVLITREFRNGLYVNYELKSWLLIETPFALLVGWETFATLANWNAAVIRLTQETGFIVPSVELTVFIVSLILIVQAAVLFAGLSMLMNPFLHIGLIWGPANVTFRLINEQHEVSRAAAMATAFVSGLSMFYMCVSLGIMLQSKFCLPPSRESICPPAHPPIDYANIMITPSDCGASAGSGGTFRLPPVVVHRTDSGNASSSCHRTVTGQPPRLSTTTVKQVSGPSDHV